MSRSVISSCARAVSTNVRRGLRVALDEIDNAASRFGRRVWAPKNTRNSIGLLAHLSMSSFVVDCATDRSHDTTSERIASWVRIGKIQTENKKRNRFTCA